jgi:hypothetical protein
MRRLPLRHRRMRGSVVSPVWVEYDAAALWCARRGFTGAVGSQLPALMSSSCLRRINYDPEAFEERVSETAYALAMEARTGP